MIKNNNSKSDTAYKSSLESLNLKMQLAVLTLFAICIFNPLLAFGKSISERNDLLAKEYIIDQKRKIEAVIASGEINRINTGSMEVMEIVGDESKYSIYWSSDYRNFFIFPKVAVGELIEISLVAAGGVTQDIRFTVGDCSAKSIFLKRAKEKGEEFPPLSSASAIENADHLLPSYNLKYEIDAMISHMQIEEDGKYYVSNNKRTISQDRKLLLRQDKSYRWKDLSGAVLTAKNKGRKSLPLNEEEIKSKFSNVVAVNFTAKEIGSKGTSKIFVITREVEDV